MSGIKAETEVACMTLRTKQVDWTLTATPIRQFNTTRYWLTWKIGRKHDQQHENENTTKLLRERWLLA